MLAYVLARPESFQGWYVENVTLFQRSDTWTFRRGARVLSYR
jgi:hypothetical protein